MNLLAQGATPLALGGWAQRLSEYLLDQVQPDEYLVQTCVTCVDLRHAHVVRQFAHL